MRSAVTEGFPVRHFQAASLVNTNPRERHFCGIDYSIKAGEPPHSKKLNP
jgi:hypothetical protein